MLDSIIAARYIFMCPNCDDNTNAAAVVDTVISNLAGVPYGMMYGFVIHQLAGSLTILFLAGLMSSSAMAAGLTLAQTLSTWLPP